jgi:hypothetical protein
LAVLIILLDYCLTIGRGHFSTFRFYYLGAAGCPAPKFRVGETIETHPYVTQALRQPRMSKSTLSKRNVMRAENSHASTMLEIWTPATQTMRVTDRNAKRFSKPFAATESRFGEIW